MTDRFAGFQPSLDAPFRHAVALLPSEDEFEPTAAIHVNWSTIILTVVAVNSSEPVDLILDRGTLRLRIKKLLAIEGSDSFASFNGGGLLGGIVQNIPTVVGLY